MLQKELSKRQSEIIREAIKLIGDGGIQSLTIKNLSAAIGIAESAIYRHFESRTAILDNLLDYLMNKVISHYNKVASMPGSSLVRIRKMISGQMKTFSENPPYAVVILSDGLYKNETDLRNKIYTLMSSAKAAFVTIIEDGQSAKEIRTDLSADQIAFVIMGSIRLTINQWSLSDFSFNLQNRGRKVYSTIETLISRKG